MTDPVRRLHYFSGQSLSPEDLQAEQDYHREMRYLHNRLLGQGVVSGLDVTAGDGSSVTVSPGLAIDGYGRELVLSDEVFVDLAGAPEVDGTRDVVAIWDQQPDSFVAPAEGCSDEAAFTRWLEQPQLALVPPGEAPEGSVVLGRIVSSGSGTAAVDVSGRSAWQRADAGPST
jgi:hypothetical protein